MKRLFERSAQIDSPKIAVMLILAALFFLSLQDGIVKSVSSATSLWQFQLLRSIANLIIIFMGLAIASEWHLLRPSNLWAVALRTIAIMATMIFFFAGAPFLTLAEMGAGLYTYPIFMTILSVLFLDEKVGAWRLLAIIIAATGAIFIIRPGGNNFEMAQLLPVAAGFCYSVNATILRRYCRSESPVTMVAWTGFGFLLVSVVGLIIVGLLPITDETRADWPFLLDVWPVLTWLLVGFAVVCAICNVLGNVFIVKAYQSAELSWLAPIDYTYLIFATIWGFVMFMDLPNGATVIGMLLIALAGSITVWRQRRSARRLPITNL